jgi:hypothetical protein
MMNVHPSAEYTDRSFPFNPSTTRIVAFCRAVDSGIAPAADLDMFTRWIRLSDHLLAASRKPGKIVGNRDRGELGLAFSVNPA